MGWKEWIRQYKLACWFTPATYSHKDRAMKVYKPGSDEYVLVPWVEFAKERAKMLCE